MGFFSAGDPQAILKLSERVADLEREVLKQSSTLKLSKMEWDDMLDKILKQVERLRKRSQTFVQDDQEAPQNQKEALQLDQTPRQTLLGQIHGGRR